MPKNELIQVDLQLRLADPMVGTDQPLLQVADRTVRNNLQQWLIGTYHGVSKAQLQVYLDEFVFRHNRRRQPMAAFQTLLGLGTRRPPTTYRRIRGARDVENDDG